MTVKFGFSWQVVPEGMGAVFSDPDPGATERAMRAMLGVRKIDVASLRAAATGR